LICIKTIILSKYINFIINLKNKILLIYKTEKSNWEYLGSSACECSGKDTSSWFLKINGILNYYNFASTTLVFAVSLDLSYYILVLCFSEYYWGVYSIYYDL
jgi:hypothetical protein